MPINDEEAKEAYFEMQAIEQQMRQLGQQINIIENQINEFQNSIEAIEGLRSKTGEEILVPVSSGIFARAELKNNDRFVVNVGANVAVEKEGFETVEILKKQIAEMQSYREQMLKGIQLMETRSKEIEKKVLGQ